MSYITIILLIGFLILVHELGHFLAAKWMNIPISRFSIGFGKKLWAFNRNGTEYRLSLFPIGGYVMVDINDPEEFYQIPRGRRIIFALCGPLANLIFAIICLAALNLSNLGFSFYGIFLEPFHQFFDILNRFLQSIPLLFSQHDQLTGIIGIVVQGGQSIGFDISKLLGLAVFLNINLAVLNLLPIPPLDGGNITLYCLEAIFKKARKLHIPLAITGWALLLGLMLYTTVLDIIRIAVAINA